MNTTVANILSIEASADACSVALQTGAGVIERNEFTPRQHSQLLLPMIDELLQQSGLALRAIDAIAFSAGPGSFTGLRLALGVAQGLAYGVDIPLIAVSSLAALAQSVIDARALQESAQVFCAVDARMGEYYLGRHIVRAGLATAVMEDALVASSEVKLSDDVVRACVLAGNLSTAAPFAGLNWRAIDSSVALARHLLPLAQLKWQQGDHTRAELAQPVYLRGKSSWKSLQQ
jgi:tRNA threonylcarbamoyladenosine biosynthesis protein TsaB